MSNRRVVSWRQTVDQDRRVILVQHWIAHMDIKWISEIKAGHGCGKRLLFLARRLLPFSFSFCFYLFPTWYHSIQAKGWSTCDTCEIPVDNTEGFPALQWIWKNLQYFSYTHSYSNNHEHTHVRTQTFTVATFIPNIYIFKYLLEMEWI